MFRFIIRPRMLSDVSSRDLSVRVMDETLPFPIGVAPTASQCMAHPDGELATSRAAAGLGTLMIASTIATTSLEDIAKAVPNAPRWFQLYVYKDRELTKQLVTRAEEAGYKALVLTVDTPLVGNRRDDARNGFSVPPYFRYLCLPPFLLSFPHSFIHSFAL